MAALGDRSSASVAGSGIAEVAVAYGSDDGDGGWHRCWRWQPAALAGLASLVGRWLAQQVWAIATVAHEVEVLW